MGRFYRKRNPGGTPKCPPSGRGEPSKEKAPSGRRGCAAFCLAGKELCGGKERELDGRGTVGSDGVEFIRLSCQALGPALALPEVGHEVHGDPASGFGRGYHF